MANLGFRDIMKLKEEGDVKGLIAAAVAVTGSTDIVTNAAAEALGQIGDQSAVQPLIAMLDDNDWKVKEKAAKALGQIGNQSAVQPLITLLKHSKTFVRVAATEALGLIGDQSAVIPLIALLDDNVKRNAATALGQIGDKRAVQPLITLLNDNDWIVKRNAATALGQIGDKRAVQPLITLFNDEDEQVLNAAAEALRQIGDPQANDALSEFDDVIKGYQEDGQLARYRLTKTSLSNPLDLEVTTEKYCVYCMHLREPNLRDSDYPKGVGECDPQMKYPSFDDSCEKWRPNKKVRFWLSMGYMENNREGWPKKPWYQVFDDGPDGEKGTH